MRHDGQLMNPGYADDILRMWSGDPPRFVRFTIEAAAAAFIFRYSSGLCITLQRLPVHPFSCNVKRQSLSHNPPS